VGSTVGKTVERKVGNMGGKTVGKMVESKGY
jgi:hypothetical protein